MKRIAIAVVEYQGQFLVGVRPDHVPLAGYWEFPGGKVEPGETAEQAAVRECQEETGVVVEPRELLLAVEHAYEHGTVQLHFFRCRVLGDQTPGFPYQWVFRDQLRTLKFPAGNAGILAMIEAGGLGPVNQKTGSK